MLPPVVMASVIISTFNPFSPYQWITASLGLMLSPSKWTSIAIMAIVIGLIAVWDSKYYSVRSPVLSTRLAHIWNMVSPQRLLFLVGHTLAAAVTTWCCVNLLGGRYQGLSNVCPQNTEDTTEVCLNEHHLFLMLHGAVIGVIYTVNFFTVPSTVLTFPVLQQSKFFQVKANLSPTLIGCFKQVARQLKYYYLSYYLILGPIFRGWIVNNLHLTESAQGAVSTLYGLCDLSLLWNTIVAGTLIFFLFTLPRLLFTIYQTERFHFPIEMVLDQNRGCTLAKALVCKQLPIVQYLGYQDLCLAAQHSPARRREIFSLSQPGGHPHHWTALSSASINILKELTVAITDFNNTLLAGGQTRQLSGDKVNQGRVAAQTPVVNQSPAMQITNLSYRGAPSSATRPLIRSPRDEQKKPDPMPSLMTKVYEQLKKRKAVAFFVAELPETASLRLFTDCQVYMWAVDALSYLVCASYSEDSYGVVQKSLPEVLGTLFTLQEAVEKHLKIAPSPNRKPGSRGSVSANNSNQRQALKVAIKTAIYRIITTFNTHLSSIPLSSENTRRLGLFMDYKE